MTDSTPTASVSREAHLNWCKVHAMEYVNRGDLADAFVSMISDLGKHDGTCNHPMIQPSTQLFLDGHLNSAEKMEKFIKGCN